MASTVRMKTVIRQCGMPRWAASQENEKAEREHRIATVHHGESANAAWYAEPGIHVVNQVGRLVFPLPLKSEWKTIVGIGRHLEAFGNAT